MEATIDSLAIADPEQALAEDMAALAGDPLSWVWYAFEWGEGDLAGHDGPDDWQAQILRDIRDGLSPDEALRIAVSSGHGVGKVQPKSLVIPTPDGFRRWGDLRPGDTVFGADGRPVRILQIHENGVMDIYRVTFDDGSSTLCGRDHNWAVRGRKQRRPNCKNIVSGEWLTMTTEEILTAGVRRKNGRTTARQWEIPKNGPVEFKPRPVPLDPYILGLWIGNGAKGSGRISCNELNGESIDRLCSIGNVNTIKDKDSDYGLVCSVYGIRETLDDLGLLDKGSSERFIPEIYKTNDIAARTELLRGLMDSDGECNKHGSSIYSTTSKKLARDILWLARSLGGKASMQPTAKLGKYKDSNGDEVECRYCYRITLTMPRGFRLFYSHRKQSRLKPQIQDRYLTRWIESIEDTGKAEDCMCITVADPDGLYLVNDFIVTHNSALVAWIVLWSLSTCPGARVVVTANTGSQLKTKTWAEIAKWKARCLTGHWFETTATALMAADAKYELTWRADAVAWSDHNSEAFAGLHNQGKRITVIFDEASAISEKIWQVTEGALTDQDTEILWLVFGNPTRNSGAFRECFRRNRHRWTHYKVDARNARLTNKDQINKWIEDHGLDSDFVKVRILGEFPDAADNQLIGADLIRSAHTRAYKPGEFDIAPVILGVDVARFGGDSCVIYRRQGLAARRIYKQTGIDTMRFADVVATYYHQEKPDAMFLDLGAMGAGVYDRLQQLGIPVQGVQFGSKAIADGLYVNRRAEMWDGIRKWLREGGSLPGTGQEAQDLEEDLTSPEYYYDTRGRMLLESKDDMKARGLPSPDDGDSLALTFAAPVIKNDQHAARRQQKPFDPLARHRR